MKNEISLLIVLAAATNLSAQTPTRRELAKAVLTESGISGRFDAYLTRGADQASGGEIRDPKMHKWLQGLWVQELGWTKVEAAYIEHFEKKFTEAELKELLVLVKNPTVKKLLKEELEAFRATFEQRNKTFAAFWLRYNSLEFSPPANEAK